MSQKCQKAKMALGLTGSKILTFFNIFYLFYFYIFLTDLGSRPPCRILGIKDNSTMVGFGTMPAITFAIQNCNSLNMSHSTSQNQNVKINAITSINSDFIFLCDLRLGNKNLTVITGEVTKKFLTNPTAAYSFLSNSTKTRRGVGILYKNSLNLDLLELRRDPGENFILAKVSVKNFTIIVGTVYGPNEHDPHFFRSLYTAIKELGNHPLIVGGDFNCTYSVDKIDSNIDCLHMVDVPNHRHSTYLREMCDALGLADPFRLLNGNKRQYSYKPFGYQRKNRSRIDFFLATIDIVGPETICNIGDSTLGSFFDHKTCRLKFKPTIKQKRKKRLMVYNNILSDPDVDIIAWIATFETYLHHLRVGVGGGGYQ
jgi:exonuclease III